MVSWFDHDHRNKSSTVHFRQKWFFLIWSCLHLYDDFECLLSHSLFQKYDDTFFYKEKNHKTKMFWSRIRESKFQKKVSHTEKWVEKKRKREKESGIIFYSTPCFYYKIQFYWLIGKKQNSMSRASNHSINEMTLSISNFFWRRLRYQTINRSWILIISVKISQLSESRYTSHNSCTSTTDVCGRRTARCGNAVWRVQSRLVCTSPRLILLWCSLLVIDAIQEYGGHSAGCAETLRGIWC